MPVIVFMERKLLATRLRECGIRRGMYLHGVRIGDLFYALHHVKQHIGKVVLDPLARQVFVTGFMKPRQYPCFIGKPRREGTNGHETPVHAHQSFTLAYLLTDNITEETSGFLAEMVAGDDDLAGDARRYDGRGQYVRVGMQEIGPRELAVVLEYLYVFETFITLEVEDAAPVHIQHQLQLRPAIHRHDLGVKPAFHDYLVSPYISHLIVQTFAPPVLRYLYHKNGVGGRKTTHDPVTAVIGIFTDSRRGQRLMTGAEGANTGSTRLRTAIPHNYPVTRQRVSS